MEKIFVLAYDQDVGMVEGETKRDSIKTVLPWLGAWTDESIAKKKCDEVNDGKEESDEPPIYVMEIKVNV